MDIAKACKLLDEFFAAGKELQYEKRTIIIDYGELSDKAYWIKQGTVKVVSYTTQGSEKIHHIYKDGELFPITSIFGNKSHDIAFIAFSKVSLMARSIAEFMEFINRNPQALLPVVEQNLAIYEKILNLNLATAEERVVSNLFDIARRFGVEEEDRIVITLPMTIQEFANNVRLSRETTGKVFKKFEESGSLIVGRRNMVIYPKKLKMVNH